MRGLSAVGRSVSHAHALALDAFAISHGDVVVGAHGPQRLLEPQHVHSVPHRDEHVNVLATAAPVVPARLLHPLRLIDEGLAVDAGDGEPRKGRFSLQHSSGAFESSCFVVRQTRPECLYFMDVHSACNCTCDRAPKSVGQFLCVAKFFTGICVKISHHKIHAKISAKNARNRLEMCKTVGRSNTSLYLTIQTLFSRPWSHA